MKRFWPIGLLLALVSIFFWRQIVRNEVLYCCDNLTIIIPSRKLFVDALSQGFVPLWNPYIFSGSPFLADINLALLSPLNTLYFFLSPFVALTTSAIASIFIALVGMYLFARYVGFSKEAGILSAIVFGFSGTLVVYANNISLIQVASLAPWVVWTVLRYVHVPNRRTLVIAAVMFSLQIISGHPQLTYYTVLFTGAFVLWREKNRKRMIIPVVFLATLVALVTAVQTIPFMELAIHSTRVGNDVAYAAFGSFNPLYLVRLIVPNVVGDLSGNFVVAAGGSIYGFVGVIPLLLLFFAKRSGALARFMFVIAIISLLLAFGSYTPLFALAYRFIPGIGLFRSPEHFLFIYTFCIALLGGLGLDGLGETSNRHRVFVIVSVLFLLGALCLLQKEQIFRFIMTTGVLPTALHAKVSHIPLPVFRQWMNLIQQNLVITAGLLAFVGILSKLLGRSFLKLGVVGVVFIELFIFSRHNLITISEKTVDGWMKEGSGTAMSLVPFDATKERLFVDQKSYFYPGARGKPYVDMPQEMEWQFKILRPNLNMIYGISSIDGYGALVYRPYAQYFQKNVVDPTGIRIPSDEAVLRSLGVTKLITTKNGQVTYTSFSLPNIKKPETLYFDPTSVKIGAILTFLGFVLLVAITMSGLQKNRLSTKHLTKTKAPRG